MNRKPLAALACAVLLLAGYSVADTSFEPPKPINKVIPVYPDAVQEEGIGGNVTVRLVVNSEGMVVGDVLVLSTPGPRLGFYAIQAAKRYRFVPAKRDGRPVATRVKMTFRFIPAQEMPRKTPSSVFHYR